MRRLPAKVLYRQFHVFSLHVLDHVELIYNFFQQKFLPVWVFRHNVKIEKFWKKNFHLENRNVV